MSEVVAIAIILQIGYQLVDTLSAGTERTTRRKMDVPYDLIEANTASDVAAFASLFFQFVRPTFLNTLGRDYRERLDKTRTKAEQVANLLNSIGIAKTPSTGNIRLSNILACVTAAALWFHTTIA